MPLCGPFVCLPYCVTWMCLFSCEQRVGHADIPDVMARPCHQCVDRFTAIVPSSCWINSYLRSGCRSLCAFIIVSSSPELTGSSAHGVSRSSSSHCRRPACRWSSSACNCLCTVCLQYAVIACSPCICVCNASCCRADRLHTSVSAFAPYFWQRHVTRVIYAIGSVARSPCGRALLHHHHPPPCIGVGNASCRRLGLFCALVSATSFVDNSVSGHLTTFNI